ncbi:MAG: class I SAM-dependent methyltransferase [Gaiellaceae bacterium]
MSDAEDLGPGTSAKNPAFGTVELLSAVAGSQRVLDAGCGTGRATVQLAKAGATVTGLDSDGDRLEEARQRAADMGVELRLVDADLNARLPFDGASFDAVTSRLALMAVADAVATLRELRRVLAPGGRVATLLWATLAENPWFAAPREAIATVLDGSRGEFARAFGRLGDPDEAASVHREAGLVDVEASVIRGQVEAADAAGHWDRLVKENGHFRRVNAGMSNAERDAVMAELANRIARYQDEGRLCLPRALVLVTARRASTC